jgi:hypothetical protein
MLIWDNCRTYNMMDSPIVQQAEIMERHMKGHAARLKIVAEFTRRVVGRRSRDEIITEAPGNVGEITLDEKAQLSEKVVNVSNQILSQMVILIETSCKSAIDYLEAEKINIRLDGLDRSTFDKVVSLINANQQISKIS